MVVTKPEEDDVGELDEDDSDLQDDSDITVPSRRRGGGGGRGGYSRGGGENINWLGYLVLSIETDMQYQHLKCEWTMHQSRGIRDGGGCRVYYYTTTCKKQGMV